MQTKTFGPREVRNFKIVNVALTSLFIILLILAFFITGCDNTTENAEETANYFSGENKFYVNWKYSSIPQRLNDELNAPLDSKAKCAWYNITPSDTKGSDILIGQSSLEYVNVLDFLFDPSLPAEYNRTENFSSMQEKWGGMMTNISSDTNYFYENKYYITLWMKIVDAPENAILNIDLGGISEEVFPDGRLSSEDKNANNRLDANEDTGIDGLPDSLEPGYDRVLNWDPNHDNFELSNANNFAKINITGTEGNSALSETGRGPDGEDLNRNYAIDLSNNYYTYSLPLDLDKLSTSRILQVGENGWFKVRIPLNDYNSKTGNNDLIYPETLRFWIEGADAQAHIRFAEINFSR